MNAAQTYTNIGNVFIIWNNVEKLNDSKLRNKKF